MKDFFNSFVFYPTLTAAIAAVSVCAFAESTTATAGATVIEPVKIAGSRIFTTDLFVSGVTGDLVIRIAAAINFALEQDEGVAFTIPTLPAAPIMDCASSAECSNAQAAGALDGNPVSSIDVGAIDVSQAGLANINVILAYN